MAADAATQSAVVTMDERIARRAGRLDGEHLASDPKPYLGPDDAIVAAPGFVHEEAVVTKDGEFEEIDGLAIDSHRRFDIDGARTTLPRQTAHPRCGSISCLLVPLDSRYRDTWIVLAVERLQRLRFGRRCGSVDGMASQAISVRRFRRSDIQVPADHPFNRRAPVEMREYRATEAVTRRNTANVANARQSRIPGRNTVSIGTRTLEPFSLPVGLNGSVRHCTPRIVPNRAMSEVPADERIEAMLGDRFDRIAIERTLHAVPPHEVYEVAVDGRRAVCKVSVDDRGSAGVEGRVQRFVDRRTSIPVPAVIDVGEDWFVAAYREGAPEEPADDERVLEDAWLRIAGRALATLHEEARFDRPGLFAVECDPNDPASDLRVDAARDVTWANGLDDQLAVYERAVSGTGYERAIAETREFLADYADRFDVLDDEASLLHGWFTPEHVAVSGGDPTCVIDFEHALAGSPEWDYWRTAVPLFLGSAWECPEGAETVFRSAYESVRPLPDGFDERAAAYRAFVAASHLDSLATQRGISEETQELADFLTVYFRDTLESCRTTWR